ncbi:MAG: Hsp70 family protein [Planctomycetaceae bacterium]|nr:Hsp70 family protein [Planctomycetaceae bacterium]
MSAEYIIGIDLGTTNSVVAYARLEREAPDVELLPIPQLVGPATIESRSGLPSFLALGGKVDPSFAVPWAENRDYHVGEWARRQSAELPDRVVSGAKSWLCHSRVDRHQPILPWNAPDEVPKISPVTATKRLVEHLIASWNQKFPDAPLIKQRVVLTVPASFDAAARELTREAAVAAGLPENFVLLEEPQAAVYAWLSEMGDSWRKTLKVGDSILVIDVGGGTTDLTLVSTGEEHGELLLRRIAVGNHLLVGGDNMDLALAHHVAERFAEQGTNLDPWQSVSLWHACRNAKEALLSDDGPDSQPVAILGRGRKLIGGTVSVDLDREMTRTLLLEGFLPSCDISESVTRKRGSGFQQIGLPYEMETGITRHIADFLTRQSVDGTPFQPTDILVNGGVFKPSSFVQRLIDVMAEWFPNNSPRPLAGERDLDHAVARGAAYYGWSKDHGGIRIRGGTARSYYVGIETAGLAIPGAPRPLNALCVVPRGMEEGTENDIPTNNVGLIVGEPVQFRFFSSPVRKDDKPGDVLTQWSADEIAETDSLEATLPIDEGEEGTYVPVRFHAKITELGMFELWCVSTTSDQEWKLEFSVREDS